MKRSVASLAAVLVAYMVCGPWSEPANASLKQDLNNFWLETYGNGSSTRASAALDQGALLPEGGWELIELGNTAVMDLLPPRPIPLAGPWGMALLVLLAGMIGGLAARWRRNR